MMRRTTPTKGSDLDDDAYAKYGEYDEDYEDLFNYPDVWEI